VIGARELFEQWKAALYSRQKSELESALPALHGDGLVTSTKKAALAGLPWIRWPARLALPKKLRKAARILFRIASDVVVALPSPLGMIRERETKARANQS
jgi:hypothetical protein